MTDEQIAQTGQTEQIVRDDLRRAALFRLLALTMTDPAKAGTATAREAFANLPEPDPVLRRFGRDVYGPARRAWQQAEPSALEAEYDRLFRRNMACPPHETAYGDGRRMGGRTAEFADIRGFYEAFGLAPSSAEPDMPDHLAAELEFYAILLLKMAYARCDGAFQGLEVSSAAAAAFLEDHLGRWPRAFREAVEAAGADSPYLETAHLVEATVAAECRRLEVRPRLVEGFAPNDPLATAETLTCPMADSCARPGVNAN